MPVPPCLVSALAFACAPAASPAPEAPHGHYVEARTASVFAGACHYGGEATTTGREALLAWHFDGGQHAGVELAGVDAAVLVESDVNLAEPRGERHAVLYVSARASAAQRFAVSELLAAELAPLTPALPTARPVELSVAFTRETYRVESPGRFALNGALLPDRACCHMPFQVWYGPLAPVEKPLVGANEEFRCTDAALARVWSRPGENASFTGAFRFTPRAGEVR